MFLKVCLLLFAFWKTSNGDCRESHYKVICETVDDFVKSEQYDWSVVMLKSDDVLKNTIERLAFNDFKRVNHLIVVNKTIGRIALSGYCNYEIHLKTVSLFDNKLSVLSKNSFFDNMQLDKLQIVNSQIKIIEPGAFGNTGAAQIKFIDLSNNLLEFLQSEVFGQDSNGTIEFLILKNNKLSFLEPNSLPPNLRVLNVNNNSLINVQDGVVDNLKKLQAAYFNHNKLLKVPNFRNSTDLEEIDLSHNQINAISRDTFANFKKLRVLDLSYNQLTFVQFLERTLVQNLQTYDPKLYISLAFNHLTDLNFGLDISSNLEANQLVLFGNPWSCSQWTVIEKYIEKTKLKRSTCDLRYFASGVFPYCVAPQHPTRDIEAFHNYDELKKYFAELVSRGKELNCTLTLENDVEKTLRLYKPTWRLCYGQSTSSYDY